MPLIPPVEQFCKDHLESEMKQSFENLEAIPYVEKCQETNFNIKSVVEATVLEKLDDMYKDPRFGPSFFIHIAKMVRNSLRLYRLHKNNPELGLFFFCCKVAPGVILHFNSATKKNEILFLLTKGDNSREKPVKLGINTILKWHRKRKTNARIAQLKEQVAMVQLENASIEAFNNFHNEVRPILNILDKGCDFTLESMQELKKREKNAAKTRCISAKKKIYLKVRKSILGLNQEMKRLIIERENHFASLNPKMFEQKVFFNMKIDHFKSLTMTCLNLKSNPLFKFLEAKLGNVVN